MTETLVAAWPSSVWDCGVVVAPRPQLGQHVHGAAQRVRRLGNAGGDLAATLVRRAGDAAELELVEQVATRDVDDPAAGGLGDEREVRGHAVGDEEAGAHTGAAVARALVGRGLGVRGLAAHAGDHDVALERPSGTGQHLHGVHRRGDTGFHVVSAHAVDPVAVTERLRQVGVAAAGDAFLVTGPRGVHVAEQQQGRPLAGAAQGADHVGPVRLDVDDAGLEPHVLEPARPAGRPPPARPPIGLGVSISSIVSWASRSASTRADRGFRRAHCASWA